MIGITTAIIQDNRIQKKDGTYSVKLRITFNRKQKYYPLNYSFTPGDWKKLNSTRPGKLKDDKIYFNEVEAEAINLIKKIKPFSFDSFERSFIQKPGGSNAVACFDNHIKELAAQERIGTAESYHNARSSFVKFYGSDKINFEDITQDWLIDYENWMLNKNNSLTTVGIYTRALRVIINIAIEEGDMSKLSYPFGVKKYTIPTGSNTKKALKISDIKKIFDYTPLSEPEDRAKDLWMFSYLCNGVNIDDIARLKYKNFAGGKITFIRQKTRRTTRQKQKPIIVIILPEIQQIIDKWGTKPDDQENYIFGILEREDTPGRVKTKIRQAIKTINKYMKRIGEELGFSMPLTTYTARHSYATVLKRSGAPIEFISESLGHKDLQTTERYLDSFEDDMKLEYQKKLLEF